MKNIKQDKPLTIINFILDETGSMESILDSTINGFNEYLSTLDKKLNIRFSLTLFNSGKIEKRYIDTSLKEVVKLNKDTYRPNEMTPLYDAIVDSTEALFSKVKDMEPRPSVVTVIMTDGQENASQKHNQNCAKDLIERLTKEYNWTFVYLGANQDAWTNSGAIGIAVGNTKVWQSTPDGTMSAFDIAAQSSNIYAMNAKLSDNSSRKGFNTSNFFDDKVIDPTKGGGQT